MNNPWKFLALGLLAAIIANLPFYSYAMSMHWDWTHNFILRALSGGLSYMGVFFHEIGHTIFMWLYGFPTIPMFDFKHGGGWAMTTESDPVLALRIAIPASLAYAAYHYRDMRPLSCAAMVLVALALCTNFSDDARRTVMNFMGEGMVPIVSAFFLHRAIMDISPRGAFERFLNAMFGFGMILHSYIDANGLLNNPVLRQQYYNQKSSHGTGDYDRIARNINIDFETVVHILMIWITIWFVAPFIVWMFSSSEDFYEEI